MEKEKVYCGECSYHDGSLINGESCNHISNIQLQEVKHKHSYREKSKTSSILKYKKLPKILNMHNSCENYKKDNSARIFFFVCMVIVIIGVYHKVMT